MGKRRAYLNCTSIIMLVIILAFMQIALAIPNDPGGIFAAQPYKLLSHSYSCKYVYVLLLNNENQVKAYHLDITKLHFIPYKSLPIYKIQLPNCNNNLYLADNREQVKQAVHHHFQGSKYKERQQI
jgi:hypothetical protein